MVIFFGTRLYGKTDAVPGFFHVSTAFGHLWFLPLLPLSTHLILESRPLEAARVKVGFSMKSTLLGWGRFATGLGACVTGAKLLSLEFAGAAMPALFIGFLGTFLYLMLSRRMRYASYDRASMLSQHLPLTTLGKLLLEARFGKIDERELPALLEAAKAQDLERSQDEHGGPEWVESEV